MQLRNFTVRNFRSITKAYKLPVSNTTVLIGPNNEGKSNVLRALVIATRLLIVRRQSVRHYPRPMRGRRRTQETEYDWQRDFPLHLQRSHSKQESVFVLEYDLSEQEVEDFYRETRSRLNGTLPIMIAIGRTNEATITIPKKGPGGKSLSAKARKIAEFVAARIDFEYIPAIRTADSAEEIVDSMVARELSTLEESPKYIEALENIADLQRPHLEALSESIRTTLVQFLPAVQSVTVKVPMDRRIDALRRSEIHIDDGTMTELRYKGDGIQSLAALGLMRHSSEKSTPRKNTVVAIEEPESHLHPKAIQELRNVIKQLAEKHQVVLTTHCPLFVARNSVKSNIIVNNRHASPARSIQAIRDVLGVQAADNLLHAELVLVVEGEDDRISLRALLSSESPTLADALKRNRLSIDSLGGGSNLAYKLGLLRSAICEYYVFLDADNAGVGACNKAIQENLLSNADYSLTRCQGLQEAEFEDLLSEALVERVLSKSYGIPAVHVPRQKKRKKWSERMASVFSSNGKLWSDAEQMKLKYDIAHAVELSPANALNSNRREVFDSLVNVLQDRLSV